MIRTGDSARRAALDAVLAVETQGSYLNLTLPRLLRDRGITGRDAAFATELGYGTARRSGVLLEVLTSASGRDATRLDPPVRAVLLLGAYQLLHTRVPARAAVATSVDLLREVAGHRAAGLVNAVLRRVAQHDWPAWIEGLAPGDPVGRTAFVTGYPRWIAETWLAALGGDGTALAAALDDTEPPLVHLAARPRAIDRDTLLGQAGSGAVAGRWSPYAVRLAGGDPAAIPAVAAGTAGVQDEGSQLVALGLAAAPLEGTDRRWLDMCAGPGGKAALLCGLLDADGSLLAGDVSPHRAALVSRSLPPPPPHRLAVAADGLRPAWCPGTFDRVLLDAPCSGLGALRRRPEARWRKQPGDPARLSELQRALLAQALDAVRPGGIVAYATCSPHPAETGAVVDAVLAGRADVERLDAGAALASVAHDLSAPTADGRDVQLWPHLHGTDAMYLALLRRHPHG